MEKRFEDFIEDAIQDMVSHRALGLAGEAGGALEDLMAEAMKPLGDDRADELLQSLRGTGLPICEHCYREGLRDGIRLVGLVEQMKNFS